MPATQKQPRTRRTPRPTMPEQEQAVALTPEEFARQTAVLELRKRKPGFRARMRASEIVATDDTVDRNLIEIHKHLLDLGILDEINSEDRRIKAYLETRAAPCSLLGDGRWVITLPLVEEVDEELDGYKARRGALVKRLCYERYEPAKAKAREALGEHFDERQYLSPADLETRFGVVTRWLTFNVPSAFENLNKELYEREVQRITGDLADAGAEMRAAMETFFAGMVEHLVEVLGTDKDGKPRKFGPSTVQKFQDFLATYNLRDMNMTSAKVRELVEQARSLMAGVRPDGLRAAGGTRESVRAGLTRIKATLSALGVEAPARRALRDDGEV